jgi:hypothetical protein
MQSLQSPLAAVFLLKMRPATRKLSDANSAILSKSADLASER